MVAFGPEDGRNFISAVSSTVAQLRQVNPNIPPVILCPYEVRRLVKSATEREMPGLVVLSIPEVLNAGSNIQIESLGEINV